MKINDMDKAVLHRLKEYFRKDWTLDRRERGCLLSLKGVIIPFENQSRTPDCTIIMGPQGFMDMCDLVEANDFDCWCHSHPIWPARPSAMDIENHRTQVDMLIYSCIYDTFARYTLNEIMIMKQQLKQGGIDGADTGRYSNGPAHGHNRRGRDRQLVLSKAL